MTPGDRADEFAAALSDRAKAGVEVQLLIIFRLSIEFME